MPLLPGRTVLRRFTAAAMRAAKNASSMVSLASKDQARARICDSGQ
jgi:hypothetical protein